MDNIPTVTDKIWAAGTLAVIIAVMTGLYFLAVEVGTVANVAFVFGYSLCYIQFKCWRFDR